MQRPVDLVVGKDEHGGLPNPGRPHLQPPEHWRLEAVAAVERPRDLVVTPSGGLVFVLDRDSSDVWHLAPDTTTPTRVTTQRGMEAYWEDTAPVVSPDGATVAFGDGGYVWTAPVDGSTPARRVVRVGAPEWLDDHRLLGVVGREGNSHLVVLDLANPWPQSIAHGDGDCGGAVVSPDRTRVAFTFWPHDDRNRSEIHILELATGESRALTGTERMQDKGPAWAPDAATIAYVSERTGWYEISLIDVGSGTEHQLTNDGADFGQLEYHAHGNQIVAARTQRGHSDLVLVDATTGAVTTVARGGVWSFPHWLPDGSIVATYEDSATAPRIERIQAREHGERTVVFAPTPVAIHSAPHVVPEEVTYTSFDGLEIHGFLFRPPHANADAPIPAIVYPHGGPTDASADEWDGVAQYFVDRGYAWFAPNFRGSTGYGRDFERGNHGVWGVDDTKDCLAAYDYLANLLWVDADRIAIVGASYGSYMALHSVVDDPEHRFKAAVCKYGDCDLKVSWAMGDREGRQDMERMMSTPFLAPAEIKAGSPVHRIDNITVPLLIAHGELDDRVHPGQSEELVAELRRFGKTFEYLTYPSEGHGFLRRAPFLDFYRRLDRFLDWYIG
jgi:dipeptidyl aminopeptidase/acylaminoacyl peptidase